MRTFRKTRQNRVNWRIRKLATYLDWTINKSDTKFLARIPRANRFQICVLTRQCYTRIESVVATAPKILKTAFTSELMILDLLLWHSLFKWISPMHWTIISGLSALVSEDPISHETYDVGDVYMRIKPPQFMEPSIRFKIVKQKMMSISKMLPRH